VDFYRPHRKFVLLAKVCLSKELSAIDGDNVELQIFRGESVAVKLLVIFMNRSCGDYLRQITATLLRDVEEMSQSLEIDPTLVKSPIELRKNNEKLLGIAQAFLDQVCSSANDFPSEGRALLAAVGKKIQKKSPDLYMQCFLNLFFLRFLVPFIVSPTHDQRSSSNRTLVLVGKTLVNLINNVHFGDKESHMKPLNKLISAPNLAKVLKFISILVDFDKSVEAEPGQEPNLAAETIQQAILRHFDVIWNQVQNDAQLQKSLQQFMSVALCSFSSVPDTRI